MVPPASHKLARGSWYSGASRRPQAATLRDSHRAVVVHSSTFKSGLRAASGKSYNPTGELPPQWFGPGPVRSPLLRASRLIVLRRVTEMFQFTHSPSTGLWIGPVVSRHDSGEVAPLGDAWVTACMQLAMHVSPVSASVIGPMHRGILLVLLCVV